MDKALNTAKRMVAILDSKKAEEIKVIRIDEVSSIADYFVIAQANNTTLVKTLADEVEVKLKEEGIYPRAEEGYRSANWIVLDYGDVICHVFLRETREFYNLERLWADGEIVPVQISEGE